VFKIWFPINDKGNLLTDRNSFLFQWNWAYLKSFWFLSFLNIQQNEHVNVLAAVILSRLDRSVLNYWFHLSGFQWRCSPFRLCIKFTPSRHNEVALMKAYNSPLERNSFEQFYCKAIRKKLTSCKWRWPRTQLRVAYGKAENGLDITELDRDLTEFTFAPPTLQLLCAPEVSPTNESHWEIRSCREIWILNNSSKIDVLSRKESWGSISYNEAPINITHWWNKPKRFLNYTFATNNCITG